MRVGRVVDLGRPWTGSVEPVAVGNEPVARGEGLPLGFPVTEIRAPPVREHDWNACALFHVLELDTVHMNGRQRDLTQAAKASIASTTVSKRIEWNRSNECCPPGNSA